MTNKGNLNFIVLTEKEKGSLLNLLKEYRHNAIKWHYTKKQEVEQELRYYGLIEF